MRKSILVGKELVFLPKIRYVAGSEFEFHQLYVSEPYDRNEKSISSPLCWSSGQHRSRGLLDCSAVADSTRH